MAEISKPSLNSHSPTDSREMIGLQEMGTQKMPVSDHINGLEYENVKSDSFILDLESFSNGIDRDFTTNSRITLQRSFSRKGPQRGGDRKIGLSPDDERDILVSSSSPRAGQIGASSTPEKPSSPRPASAVAVAAVGAADNPTNQLPQHQITIKTSSISTVPDSRWVRSYSLRRSPPSWFFNPKRILLFFATMSSVGTMLLIFFTLSMSQPNENIDSSLGWQP
ncbi:hypothetical protein Ancab_033568 [Ancistrocladus abbreviatus]